MSNQDEPLDRMQDRILEWGFAEYTRDGTRTFNLNDFPGGEVTIDGLVYAALHLASEGLITINNDVGTEFFLEYSGIVKLSSKDESDEI